MSKRGYRTNLPGWSFALGWALAGLPVVALLMRFAMRALGVLPDVPLPGLIYQATEPLVLPFYRFFPAGADTRFDTRSVEVASLAAAGALFAVAFLIYLVSFLIVARTERAGRTSAAGN